MATAEKAENIQNVSGDEWETLVEESGKPLSFENEGDQFVGTYVGSRQIEPDGWDEKDYFLQHQFRDDAGMLHVINGGYKLNESLTPDVEGKKVRITRTADVEINDPGKNAMKDYRIEVAKS
jgi:hypothetical protein